MNNKVKHTLISIIKYIFLTSFALLALVPFLWVLLSSFKENPEIFSTPFAFPKTFSLKNYIEAWNTGHIGTYFFNSLFISISTVSIQLTITSMAAYILKRLIKVPILNTYMTLGLLIPIHAMLIPNFIIMRNLGMINNQIGLIFIYVATGVSFSFFLLSGFLNTIPKEMDESAKIDGAGYVRIFLSILLPVIKPGLATVATFSFLHSWNEFLFGLIMITGERKMTITVGIDTLKGMYTTQYGLLCAGLMFAIVPMVIIYILLQEHVIKGVTAGAVKG